MAKPTPPVCTAEDASQNSLEGERLYNSKVGANR